MPTPIELANFHLAIPAAQLSAKKWGVPASVTLAQWMPESSWGQSELAKQANNFFGIKYSHLRGDEAYVEMPTAEYIAGKRVIVEAEFVKYPSIAASFDDHGKLLATAARYKPAMAVAGSPLRFAVQLQACGYSTSQEYSSGLMRFIGAFNLTQYDSAPPATPAALEAA